MINEFISERLLLTDLAAEHADFILELLNTEGWLNFIGDRNVHTVEDALAYIEKINKSGYAKYWTVYGKDNEEPMGIVTLIKREYLDDHDIGFAFLPRHNGNGYAFEAVKLVLATLLIRPAYSTLAAVTLPTNQRSIKLLKKLGFQFSRDITRDNELLHIYQIEHSQIT
jgi:RimJ/RimL family protein N-acetyltransferase